MASHDEPEVPTKVSDEEPSFHEITLMSYVEEKDGTNVPAAPIILRVNKDEEYDLSPINIAVPYELARCKSVQVIAIDTTNSDYRTFSCFLQGPEELARFLSISSGAKIHLYGTFTRAQLRQIKQFANREDLDQVIDAYFKFYDFVAHSQQ